VSDRADWIIDLGHSRVKWARACDGEMQADSIGSAGLDQLDRFEQALAIAGGRAWLSGQSNVDSVNQITQCVSRLGLSLQAVRTGSLPLPVQPAYAALGCDRWLALQWPWLASRRAFCVVDCGTAVTVDVVDAHGVHRGGWIMAGLATLRQAIRARARGLPELSQVDTSISGPATDTISAMAGGTLLQVAAAIDRAVDIATRTLDQQPALWLTGGDAPTLLPHLQRQFSHDPQLVLRGLALATRSTS
jgi:type III pantothenate kinase